ncbi:MAG: aspartate/glutamate racemase, partial [Zetaproteobacteria bacterium]|nr:aspartate/glutamate racemase [Pseudobdellovibrionaceae bacterium]
MVVTPQQGKLLGVIGGLSWHSTQEYYRYINEQVIKVWGEQRNPRMMIHSLDFRRVSDLFVKPKLAVEYIVDHCLVLEKAGCDALLLASNTVHVSSSVIADKVNIPLLHIADAVADDMKARGLQRVLLLGTRYTMTLP